MDSVVQKFLGHYEREYNFFSELADLAAQRVDVWLRVNGIRAIVSSRAKNSESLQRKLLHRDTEKNYQTIEDIYSDIPDLAGVRIALYFPNDLPRVENYLLNEFNLVLKKVYPIPPNGEKRFSGYHATHLRLKFKEEACEKRYCQYQIEFQVASLIMHAWAEVEHDLIYKPTTGSLSSDEYHILDQINGLIIASEMSLSMLQKAMETRLTKGSSKFRDQYELKIFLESVLSFANTKEEFLGFRLDALLLLLKDVEKDSPNKLMELIKSTEGYESYDAINFIISRLISENVSNFDNYNNYLNNLDRTNKEAQYVYYSFIRIWSTLEKFLLDASNDGGLRSRPNTKTLFEQARKADIINDFELGYLLYQIKIRNEIVRGLNFEIGIAETMDAIELIKSIIIRNTDNTKEVVSVAASNAKNEIDV